MSENTTPQELNADWEAIAENSNRANAGRGDAVYHVGKLVSGEWSPQFVAELQAGIADTADYDYDAKYHYGYLTAWNTLAGLLKGESLKTIAKNHG
jgi:hypothetical protein